MTTINTTVTETAVVKVRSPRSELKFQVKKAKSAMSAAFRAFKRTPSVAHWNKVEAAMLAFQTARMDLAVFNEVNPIERAEELDLGA
jgi:hypothetical protein